MAKIETKFTPTGYKIKEIIARILARELNLELGCIIGSWGDTLSEDEIYTLLKQIEDADSPIQHIESN